MPKTTAPAPEQLWDAPTDSSDEDYSTPIGEEEYIPDDDYDTEDAPVDELEEGDGEYLPIAATPVTVNSFAGLSDQEFDRQGKISLHRKIAQVQAEIWGLVATGKDARGNASLDSSDVLNTIRPVCAQHGITMLLSQSSANHETVDRVTYFFEGGQKQEKINTVMKGEVLATLTLTCIDTGYSEQFNYFAVAEHVNGCQAIQMATTFASRLVVTTTFGFAEAKGGAPSKAPNVASPAKPKTDKVNVKQIELARAKAKEFGFKKTGWMNLLKAYGVSQIEDLPWKKFNDFLAECQSPEKADKYNSPT
jgi:ERF superfamily